MAGVILSGLFWAVALGLQVYSVRAGGWSLLVPAAAAAALAAVGLDMLAHRRLVKLDREFARTLLHVLSAVTLAAFSLLWLVRLLGHAPGR
ncbi:MAG: hypothetical protein SCH98_12810 [Deferrisomatales bacterium]|nr:hypothetical protein [Deferrisomatales bacterium]